MEVINAASGKIVTLGESSYGILAQSVGGGGGSAGAATSSAEGAAKGSTHLTLAIGGSGGEANGGGAVKITNSGTILTLGAFAHGIFAESVGGGGGAGAAGTNTSTGELNLGGGFGSSGAGGANGATVSVDNIGRIITMGDGAFGIMAQSVGGGGGYGATSSASREGEDGLTVAVGGRGGAGGAGGDVTVKVSGSIVTSGAQAHGVFVQSVGGGGGYGGAAVGQSGTLGVGGNGGSGGDGGDVTVIRTGSITTTGPGSIGIIAQSVGGGGGYGGAGVGTLGFFAKLAGAGGATGDTGIGGKVTIIQHGDVTTDGDHSHGIFAQSVGGGGGLGGLSPEGIGNSFAGTNGGVGDAAPIKLTAFDDVTVRGRSSFGLFGQSAAGIGEGKSGNLEAWGNVLATGHNSVAIYGQSTGSLGQDDINITTAAGTLVQGGAFYGSGVRFEGGDRNLLVNQAKLNSRSSLAIAGTTGDETVINSGTVVGSVDLGGGINTFYNLGVGTFYSGIKVKLGLAGLLANDGLLAAGGMNILQTTIVTGRLRQGLSGIYGVDLRFEDTASDRTNVSGTAHLTGRVRLNILDPGLAPTGSHEATILSAGDGVTSHQGLRLEAPVSAVAEFSLSYPNPNDVVEHYDIDFAPSRLTQNQRNVGQAINRFQSNPETAFERLAIGLLGIPTVDKLGLAYDSLSGEGTAAVQQATFSSQRLLLDTVTRNAVSALAPRASDSIGLFPGKGADKDSSKEKVVIPRPENTWRTWAAGFGNTGRFEANPDDGSASAEFSGGGGVGGIDFLGETHLELGLFGYGSGASYSVASRFTHGRVEGGGVGVYGAGRWNALYVTGTLAYGRFHNTGQRDLVGAFAGPAERAQGEFDSDTFSGHLELGWNCTAGPLTVTPFAALQFTSLWTDGYNESSKLRGSDERGQLALRYRPRNTTSLPLTVGVRLEGAVPLKGQRTLTPFVQAAWVHEFGSKREISADFHSAPGFGFHVAGARAPEDAAQIAAGVKFDLSEKVSLTAGYVGEFSASSSTHGGTGAINISW